LETERSVLHGPRTEQDLARRLGGEAQGAGLTRRLGSSVQDGFVQNGFVQGFTRRLATAAVIVFRAGSGMEPVTEAVTILREGSAAGLTTVLRAGGSAAELRIVLRAGSAA